MKELPDFFILVFIELNPLDYFQPFLGKIAAIEREPAEKSQVQRPGKCQVRTDTRLTDRKVPQSHKIHEQKANIFEDLVL